MRFEQLRRHIMASIVICLVSSGGALCRTPQSYLPFKGTASGGWLAVATMRNRDQQYVSIVTSAGESAESVAQRMTAAINKWNASTPWGYWPLWDGSFQASAEGAILALPGGYWALAGTESGLGIPAPPVSLSCWYDSAADKIHLRWLNPPGGYDSIRVECFSTKARRPRCTEILAGTATSVTIDTAFIDVNEFDATVVGYKEGLPSNSTAIRLSDRGLCQSEIYGIPFTGGVAPNWAAWSTGETIDASAFRQQRKYDGYAGGMSTLLGKTLYQEIKAPARGVTHGMWRKFLGLTPGHTYRLTAALSTLEMDSLKGECSFSLCAAADGSDGKELTARQLAGLAALPDGREGPQAGRIIWYGPGNTSRGIWEIILTGHKPGLGRKPAGPHITLPADVNTITVWLRFRCSDPNGQVAFSGVKLEDLTAAGGKVPTPQGVIGQERKEQGDFRNGEAWLKEEAASK